MIGGDELDRFGAISDQMNKLKTLFSGAKSPNYASVAEQSTPDINTSDDSGIAGLVNAKNKPDMGLDKIMDSVLGGGGLASIFNNKSLSKIKKAFSKLKEQKNKKSILQQLIDLIIGISTLPLRIGYAGLSLASAGLGLSVGIDGIIKSLGLASFDIFLLILTIFGIVLKYSLCILSFVLTTIGGCFLIHVITLIFYMIWALITLLTNQVDDFMGTDITPEIEEMLESVKYPDVIQLICYSCFGIPVKLRDVLADVGVIEDIGDTIAYDFNNVIPSYMKPSAPFGKTAMDNLNKAIR